MNEDHENDFSQILSNDLALIALYRLLNATHYPYLDQEIHQMLDHRSITFVLNSTTV